MGLWAWLRRKKPEEDEAIRPTFGIIEKFGENLTPNMRALRLTMTVSDIMLSMGVSANSVVSRALDVTETYCTRPVHVDIVSNVIMLSQLRGVNKEPLTLMRPVTVREVNYMTLRDVQNLVHEIHKGNVALDEAEEQLDKIMRQPATYPWWLIMIGNGVLVAGVSMMFTSSWQAILTTFVIGILVDRILYYLGLQAFPPFFRQIAAAAFVTIAAAVLHMLGQHGVEFFAGMNPTLIVVCGIVMLVAGLVIVGAIQDAIEEYYVTANARLMKVILQTIGIVIGILVGLYVARKIGIGIAVSPDPLTLNVIPVQVVGAALAAIGYAIATQTYVKAILGIGVIGGISLTILYGLGHWYGVSVVPASGIAAFVVGITGALMSRFWRTPSVGIIAAGIIPLVPGLMLYTGLMQLINYPPGDPLFFKSLGTLFTVGTTGLAIAAGATLGSMIGRPVRQQLAHNRNLVPFANFMRRQIKPHSKHGLAGLALYANNFFSQHKARPSEASDSRLDKDDDSPVL